MIGAHLKKTYAMTDHGVKNVMMGTLTTTITNLVIMAGMSLVYLLMQGFIAHLTQGESLPAPTQFLIALVVFALALFVAQLFAYTYTYGVVYEESGAQRIHLAERLRKLPLSFFGHRDLADLTETIMGDVAIMEHAYSHVLGQLFGALIASAVVAVGLAFYNFELMVAALWSIPIALGILFGLRKLLAPAQNRARAMKVAAAEEIQETIDCIREIRATNQGARYMKALSQTIDTSEREGFALEVISGIVVTSAMIILRLSLPTTILVALSLIAEGKIDFMVLFGFLLVVSRIYAPFDQCLMLITELFASRSSAARMLAIQEEPLAGGALSFTPQNHDVCFEHVSFSYGETGSGIADSQMLERSTQLEPAGASVAAAGQQVLKDISFTAKEGEVTALVGPSGSGKSTCARLAARFWDPEDGRVLVGGVDIAQVDPEVLLGHYAVVFQDVVLFDDTVMGNIRLGRRDATDEEVRAAAAAANCDEFVERLPEGYDTFIGENGSKLSGGERQRISIARALLKDAPIVLLDEATASLDVESETKVQEALSCLLANKTVIVIAHRMRTVADADHVVVLDGGRVLEEGSPCELRAQGGLFARMVELQRESATWTL
ncbi:ABC transporter ATP-binding protein/permease [Collinsella sp. AGMB00827]|uniref:ABC transporter ATP-binding protein/permease n=1 Tax=Collinsella ureilytica TaxID=2869515 RepID=A0ABS7MLL6_9ACTN|nr:ABC transporter ATP-binding protein [Collinsella urealyticum]MBY4798172.1 ABC transporter ATP-binding protein/permease [Collinsella urealyticum]